MLYYADEALRIRDMVQADARIITDGEIAQGWDQTIDKYEMRLRHQADVCQAWLYPRRQWRVVSKCRLSCLWPLRQRRRPGTVSIQKAAVME